MDHFTDTLLIYALWFQDKAHSPRNTTVHSSVAAVAPAAQDVRWHTDMTVQLIWPFVAAADLTRVHCISSWLTGRDMGLRDGNKHFCRPRHRIGNCNSWSFEGSYLPHLQGQAVQYVMIITQWHGVTIQSILIFNSTPVMTAEVRSSPSVTPRVLAPGTGLRCKVPTSHDCSDQSYIKCIIFSTVVHILYYSWILIFFNLLIFLLIAHCRPSARDLPDYTAQMVGAISFRWYMASISGE